MFSSSRGRDLEVGLVVGFRGDHLLVGFACVGLVENRARFVGATSLRPPSQCRHAAVLLALPAVVAVSRSGVALVSRSDISPHESTRKKKGAWQ